ncbi:hypothetical protein ACSAIN_003462 [Escherichia coli]|nr:hypothetical protein [Escherichia coli]
MFSGTKKLSNKNNADQFL